MGAIVMEMQFLLTRHRPSIFRRRMKDPLLDGSHYHLVDPVPHSLLRSGLRDSSIAVDQYIHHHIAGRPSRQIRHIRSLAGECLNEHDGDGPSSEGIVSCCSVRMRRYWRICSRCGFGGRTNRRKNNGLPSRLRGMHTFRNCRRRDRRLPRRIHQEHSRAVCSSCRRHPPDPAPPTIRQNQDQENVQERRNPKPPFQGSGPQIIERSDPSNHIPPKPRQSLSPVWTDPIPARTPPILLFEGSHFSERPVKLVLNQVSVSTILKFGRLIR